MNRILIKDYTPDVVDNIDALTAANNSPEWQDEIDPPRERPVQYDQYCDLFHQSNRCEENYASFERLGVPLLRLGTVLADTDSNIGVTSGMITRVARLRISPTMPIDYVAANCGVGVDIEFSEPIILSKGLSITMLEEMDYSALISITYSNGTSEDIDAYFNGRGLQIDPTSAEYSSVDWSSPVSSIYISVWTNLPPSQLDAEPVFCKLIGIDFGCDKYVDNIDGTIDIHGEIALTLDDAPGCTCNLTVQAQFVPEEGQTLIVESDYYTGKFTIDNVEREAKDIFTIQCSDDMQKLDSFLLFSPTEDTPYVDYSGNPDDLLGDADVMWSDFASGVVVGCFKNELTCREAMAMFGIATDSAITCWKDLVGIHQSMFKLRSTEKQIDNDRVFAYPTYESRQSYRYVDFYIENSDSYDEVYVDLNTNQNHALGYYRMDKSMMSVGPTWSHANNVIAAQSIAELLNGDEVTAEIVYDNEDLGDLVTIPTPYNGNVTGRIRSIDLQIGSNAAVATIIVRKVS